MNIRAHYLILHSICQTSALKSHKKVLSESGERRSMISTGVNSSGGNLDLMENLTGLDYMAPLKFYACIGKGM